MIFRASLKSSVAKTSWRY